MARIAGVDLPREKRVEIGLTYIYGIGRKLSNDILKKTGINPDTRVKDLTEDEAAKLREARSRGSSRCRRARKRACGPPGPRRNRRRR